MMTSKHMIGAQEPKGSEEGIDEAWRSGLEVDVNLDEDSWLETLPHVAETIKETIRVSLIDQATSDIETISARQEISVLLTNDREITEMNKRFRQKNVPTNVLSFANSGLEDEQIHHWGDIVLAFETLCREATERNISLENHLMHLTIHGLLHLLGHDHMSEEAADEMEAIEIRILAELGVASPYEDRILTFQSPEV